MVGKRDGWFVVTVISVWWAGWCVMIQEYKEHAFHQCWVSTVVAVQRYPSVGWVTLLIVAFSFFCGWAPVMAGPVDVVVKKVTTPADVLQAMRYLDQELEALRRYVGAAKSDVLEFHVGQVAPHDVYFQALTLYQKTHRLYFEITREQQKPPEIIARVRTPADVLTVVESAHQLLDNVINEFDFVVEHQAIEKQKNITPSHVFQTIQATNRQLNHIIERRFAPSDTYMQITRAMGYAVRLLISYPEATPLPNPPPYEPNKTSGDVFLSLLACLNEVNTIYQLASLPALTIDASRLESETINPSDVFDLAALVVARLDYLHYEMGLQEVPPEAYYPGRKYPSDLYQRAAILLNQLQQFVRLIPKHGLPRPWGGEEP